MKRNTKRIAIIGRGRLGTAVQQALEARGAQGVLLSLEDGFDISKPVSFEGLGQFDAVVEATDRFTRDKNVAIDFFTKSTKHINAATVEVGIKKHILITIAHATKPQLSGNGYYAGKAAQERIARQEGKNMTIIHSTLWFEFARQNIDRMRIGPFAIVPKMTTQPIALDSLADVIAECCTGERQDVEYTLCGPEIMTLWQMTKLLPQKRCIPVSIPAPGVAGKALRDGTLLPDLAICEVVGPTYKDWLASTNKSNTKDRK